MRRRPPRSTLSDTLFPYPTLVRSHMVMAGILPGLLLAVAYGVSIAAMARLVPHFVGGSATGHAVTGELMGLRAMLVKLLPTLLLIVAALGAIYGGFFTTTDAGSAGAAGALVLRSVMRRPHTLGRRPRRKN